MTDDYIYPDCEDRILNSFVSQTEPYKGYWLESENRALARLADYLGEALPPRDWVRALDAGCGPGRALPWIAKFASRICAIDPDTDRLASARNLDFKTEAGETAVEFYNVTIDQMRDGQYELIVCNHVLQHVSTEASRAMLVTFRNLAAQGSVLVVSFSRSAIGNESFGIAYMDDGNPNFELVDRATFNAVADGKGRTGIVPVRKFDPDVFAAEALAAGWVVKWSWTYHAANWAETGVDKNIDENVNSNPSFRRQAQGDIYVAMHLRET